MSTENGPRIAVLDDYQDVALSSADWDRLGTQNVDVFHDHVNDIDELVRRLEPYQVVVIMRERTPFPGALLERLPRLRLLVTTGPANAAIDMEAAERAGVTVCGTRYSAHDTAEHTWALILALLRNIPQERASVRSGGWQVGLGRSLVGARLGILGLGHLGTRVARVGTAFDMDVVAWSPNLTEVRAREGGARLVTKEELFETSDVISIHMKLSDTTHHLVARDELNRMRSDAVLVNTSRGPLVDEAALIDVLEGERIGGAALDVFTEEPLPSEHPFRRLPNVLATPHVGYVTEECYRIFYGDAVEDIAAFQQGEPIRLAGSAAATSRDLNEAFGVT